MKTLIVEDDYITSQVMKEILKSFGQCDVAEDGKRGIELFQEALDNNTMYDIVFLDIMMPELDGQEVLTLIRHEESQRDIMGLDATKIIMTTALDDYENISSAFKNQCEGYLVKPIDKDKIVKKLSELGLIG